MTRSCQKARATGTTGTPLVWCATELFLGRQKGIPTAMWAALPARACCQAQPFLPPACLGAAHLPAPSGRTLAKCTTARCVRTRAAQVDVATEKDLASISSALKEAIAAEDYALAAKLRDELQRLPEVELEACLRRAVEQEDYAVWRSAGPVGCGTACSKCWVSMRAPACPRKHGRNLRALAGTPQQCRY